MPQVELSTTASSALALVAASNASANVKRVADYVCDGTADQVQINQALSDNQAGASSGLGGVQLSGGRFNLTGSILMFPAQTLRGAGVGATQLRAVSDFNGYVVENDDNDANVLEIGHFFIDGNYQDVGGIRVENSLTNQYGNEPVQSNPDAVHFVHDVFIKDCGKNGTGNKHGIWFYSANASGGSRGSRIHNIRVHSQAGDGIRLEASSDNFVVQTLVNTNRDDGGVGYRVAGGSCKFVQSKTAYTQSDGFLITSSRAHLTGCSAQDAGGWGYNIQSDATLVSCIADSNARLQTGGADSGFRIASSDVMLSGCRAVDRNQSANRQEYGYRYVSGDDLWVEGTAKNNTVADHVGSWVSASNRYVRILGDDGHFISQT